MHDVFISHARDDSKFAERLGADLTSHGLDVWAAENYVQPGTQLAKAIEGAIEDSRNILFVLSHKTSKSGWQRAETALALTQEGKRLIPIYHSENAEVPFLLRSFKGMDFSAASAYSTQIQRLALLLRSQDPHLDDINSAHEARRKFVAAETVMMDEEMRDFDARALHTYHAMNSGLLRVAAVAGMVAVLMAIASVVHSWATVAIVAVAGSGVGIGFAATSTLNHLRRFARRDKGSE